MRLLRLRDSGVRALLAVAVGEVAPACRPDAIYGVTAFASSQIWGGMRLVVIVKRTSLWDTTISVSAEESHCSCASVGFFDAGAVSGSIILVDHS